MGTERKVLLSKNMNPVYSVKGTTKNGGKPPYCDIPKRQPALSYL